MPARSSNPEVRNPVLGLPVAVEALQSLDAQQRHALKVVLLAVRSQALPKERESYRKRKGPMVSYWMSVATWAKHIANALGRQHAGPRLALHDIAEERRRQIAVEGWAPEHDDEHGAGEMARAAAAYAYSTSLPPEIRRVVTGIYSIDNDGMLRDLWPWSRSWWKPKDHRRDLVRAGALIVAEIERLDRAASRAAPAHG